MNALTNHLTRLHNGVSIPTIGYRIDREIKDTMYDTVLLALEAGFRHLDLPWDDESECIIGKAIKDSSIPRNELFLTMKLGNENHTFHKANAALKHSLHNVGTDYVDMYLVNWPNPIQYRDTYETSSIETWRSLEENYKNGKARVIGLANFEARHIEHILEHAEIAPMFNQARIYPGFPFVDNLDCANKHGIQTIGFLPPHHQDIHNSRELKIFSEKYQVTPRQICMRYLLEKDCCILTQGVDFEELKYSAKVFDFTLSRKTYFI